MKELGDLKLLLEAALAAAGEPLSVSRLQGLFPDDPPTPEVLTAALHGLAEDYRERALELVEVASGYRLQVRPAYARRITGLWEERPGRYSRALLETLVLVAYRQPITRAEIEEVRGVAVSSSIVKTLLERGWVKILGHREVPGRPALYGTTREFLDYFHLQNLSDLPPLPEPRDLDAVGQELEARLTSDSGTPS